MYISKMLVKNFRGFNESGIEINFGKGINTIIGENNTGKSTVIDAIQLALSSWQYKRNIYIKQEDFHINSRGEQADKISFDIFFEDLSDEQKPSFYCLINGEDNSKAELHIEYFLKKDMAGETRINEKITGGVNSNQINKEELEYINLLYLPALRNVEVDLKPSRRSHLSDILRSVASKKEDKDRIIESLLSANNEIRNDKAIKEVEKTINKNLLSIEKEFLNQRIKVNLLEPSFESVAGSLGVTYLVKDQIIKIHKDQLDENLNKFGISFVDVNDKFLPIEDDYFEFNLNTIENDESLEELYEELTYLANNIPLSQNGLGYNNLLSMATSMTSLQKKPQTESYSIFLIEEPEAHLHPQLLELLFNFFKTSNYDEKVQIFVTSHSPTLVSKVDINSIILINMEEYKSSCVSLRNTNLSPIEKNDLKRYLDVTKSQLFFAKKVIFVEGITEAILVNTFAKILKTPLDKYAVEIVNIQGVAFNVFAKLFKFDDQQPGKDFLNIRCSIISDDDRCTNDADDYRITKEDLKSANFDVEKIKMKLESGEISHRAGKLLEFNDQNIKVNLAKKTLEYELASYKENNDILLAILKEEHPTLASEIKKNIEQGETQDKTAIRFWKAIRDCKGSFAQKLAEKLENEGYTNFKIPQYIENAIRHITGV